MVERTGGVEFPIDITPWGGRGHISIINKTCSGEACGGEIAKCSNMMTPDDKEATSCAHE